MYNYFERNKSKNYILIPIFIGLFAFVLITGGAILDPLNIGWMALGDPRQHYLGWAFFRQDEWRLPVGLNPDFGLELGSAIALSDSLPLFAFPFKLLQPWLPPVFQYFGLWVLLCFVFQSIIAWKISGLVSRDVWLRTAMTGFFVFAPPMLWRLHGHMSLVGHFLVLTAIYLSLISREKRHSVAFVVLAGISAAVHAYLLAMVSAIWIASLADAIWRRKVGWIAAAIEFCLGITLIGLMCWQVGFFSVGQDVSSGGYGFYRMNLLSLFNADGWSRFLPGIRGGSGDYEGFNYLGVGLMIVAIAAVPFVFKSSRRLPELISDAPFTFLLMIGLSIFALSNNIGLGTRSISYPLPDGVEKFANIFRSSGRMFWPVYYMLMLGILVAAIRGLGTRRARVLLIVALVLQVVDTSAGWTFRQIQLTRPVSDQWASPMHDPFWEKAARRYANIRWIMPENQSPHWAELSDYAARHGMATDATFLARIGMQDLAQARAKASRQLETGHFDADSLYVLDAGKARQLLGRVSPHDMMAIIDGFYVLAPGWRACADCRQDYGFSQESFFGPLVTHQDIVFAAPESAPYRVEGWSDPEAWGIWSVEDKAILGFSSALPRRFRLIMDAQAFGPNVGREFAFSAGGAPAFAILGHRPERVTLELTAAPGTHLIEITVPQATSPQELGSSSDSRRLGIGLSHFRIEPLE